ncbi:unnamed protein product [Diplocarpon coronariae]
MLLCPLEEVPTAYGPDVQVSAITTMFISWLSRNPGVDSAVSGNNLPSIPQYAQRSRAMDIGQPRSTRDAANKIQHGLEGEHNRVTRELTMSVVHAIIITAIVKSESLIFQDTMHRRKSSLPRLRRSTLDDSRPFAGRQLDQAKSKTKLQTTSPSQLPHHLGVPRSSMHTPLEICYGSSGVLDSRTGNFIMMLSWRLSYKRMQSSGIYHQTSLISILIKYANLQGLEHISKRHAPINQTDVSPLISNPRG